MDTRRACSCRRRFYLAGSSLLRLTVGNEPEHVVLSQLNAADVRKRLQIARLVFAARARGSRHLHSRAQAVPIEFTGDIMRCVVCAWRAGAPALERVGGEILDDL